MNVVTSHPTARKVEARWPLPVRFMAVLGSLIAACWLAGPATAAPPANDGFASPVILSGTAASVIGTNVEATNEPGEPTHAETGGGHSVWYSWTAPAGPGEVAIRTTGSDFDTVLAVYVGDSLAALTETAANDDYNNLSSRVAFQTAAGTTYRIAVDGYHAGVGNIRLRVRWRAAPANDAFDMAQAVAGPNGTVTGSNVAASREPGEPFHARRFGGHSVWYRWIAPADGYVQFNTRGSDFDTLLGIYTGASVDALVLVARNDDDRLEGGTASHAHFTAVAGTTYQIAVDGFSGASGDLSLSWSPLLLGSSGDDRLVGSSGPEEIRGLGGDDAIIGGGGDDVVYPGRGNDDAKGQAGLDRIVDRSGADSLRGGRDSDLLNARDYRNDDVVHGGPGLDTCRVNRGDVMTSCP